MTLIDHINSGGQVQTRDGRAVTIYCTDVPGKWPIHGRVEDILGAITWRADGTPGWGRNNSFDLIPILPPKPSFKERAIEALRKRSLQSGFHPASGAIGNAIAIIEALEE